MATNPDLPESILLEIFSRLPAKSVGKCRCLSKSWRRDLSTSHFINKHLTTRQQTTTHQQNLALVTAFTTLHIVTSPFKIDEQLKLWTGGLSGRCYLVLGSCNGLLLLSPSDKILFIVNPITLHQVKVPDPPPILSDSYQSRVYGFGYDCNSDDFKAIILSSCPPAYQYQQHFNKYTVVVDVFSVKRGVWNRLDNGYPYADDLVPLKSLHNDGVLVNGAVHWFICKRKTGFYCHIAAFDLTKEVFHEIPIPAEFDRNRPDGDDEMDSSRIAVIGGCLSIVYNLSSSGGGGGGTDLWVMKEYGVAESWVRFHVLVHTFGRSIVPLCMVGDEQLVCYTQNEALVACDLKDGTTKELIVGGFDQWYGGGIAFVDSLVYPGKSECGDDPG